MYAVNQKIANCLTFAQVRTLIIIITFTNQLSVEDALFTNGKYSNHFYHQAMHFAGCKIWSRHTQHIV